MSNSKFLLIICEGLSDQVTLYSATKNFIKKKNIRIQPRTTSGDIALKEDATKESCFEEIKNIITSFKKNYNLFPSDFFGVYHIVDTDAAFTPADIYVETDHGYYIKNGLIYTDNIDYSKERNKNKREIYEYLLSLKKIESVPYKILFFSRNLEHDLYDKPNCTEEEKIKLSDAFEEMFSSNAKDFYDALEAVRFETPKEYEQSWVYIMSGTNSLKRGNNYISLLDELEKVKK